MIRKSKFGIKREKNNSVKIASVFQIFLMIGMVFSFSIILGGEEVRGATYEVTKGDSLSQIAKKYKTTTAELLRLNPKYAKNPNVIVVGDKIKLPSIAGGKGSNSQTPVGYASYYPNPNIGSDSKIPAKVKASAEGIKVDLVGGTEKIKISDAIKSNQAIKTGGTIADVNKISNGNTEVIFSDGKKITYNSNGEYVSSGEAKVFNQFGLQLTGPLAALASGVFWAGIIVGAVQMFGPMFGLNSNQVNALSLAATVGIFAAKGASYLAKDQAVTWLQGSWGGLTTAAWVGVGVAALVFVLMYKKEKQETITFECRPWQAPKGGSDCEKCNDKDLPCSEYQCKALGQSCDLVNKGTKEEKCVWVNRQDVNPPVMTPSVEHLLPDYRYTPSNAVSPPDRGVDVLYDKSRDNCIPAFTPLSIGVELNEPAACKVDVLRKEKYADMRASMSSGLLRYNHSFALSLPGSEALESNNITLINDGNYELYVRCQDANGNENTANLVFRYCVDKGPDTTAPLIITTSLLNGLPIGFNQTSTNLDIFVNEPSDCKWSKNDRDYGSMEESMACTSNVFEFNAQSLYKCSTTLTGLKDKVPNDFYFRCKDKPGKPEADRNVNAESYKFTLLGTQPLVINSVTPNKTTVSDSTDTVKVEIKAKTLAGHDKGQAICYYSDTGNENDYIKFFNTVSHEHTQDLFLLGGSYEYFIKCVDLGGNTDYDRIEFDVEVDSESPRVVRAYKQEDSLKIVTNENAECVYSTFDCSYEFGEGTALTTVNGTGHFTPWSIESSYYIKCQDSHGNSNLPNECGLIVKPSKN
jgi:hypothetical protein